MLDSIINLVKDQAFGAITNNTQIPADKKDAAVETTTSAIIDGLKSHLNSNSLSTVMELFNDGPSSTNNSMVDSLQHSVSSALTQKVGLSSGVSSAIASAVIPAIVALISRKSNDPNDSFNIESLVKSVAGGKGGILGAIGSLFGK